MSREESAEIHAVVADEEELLERVRTAIERARRRAAARRERDRTAELRAIRDEAAEAHPEDLPSLLHDLDLGQRLEARRGAERFPNPASPYVAHVRVDEGNGPVDYLLGHVSFFDSRHGVHVVDWRVAPVARIFYRYREGDHYEETFPGRVAEGVVTARRIVVIENGSLARI
ncbi:MAG: ATP-binding domain-containing protein, partial [Candidatus Binatia bacterium]